MKSRRRVKERGNDSSGKLMDMLHRSFAEGHILDQVSYLREACSQEFSRATFFRCLRKIFDLGHISKIVIEVISDGLESSVYPLGSQKVVCIPRNEEIERIFAKQARNFEFKDEIEIEENQEGRKTVKIKAKALKNVKGPISRLLVYNVPVNVTYSVYVKSFPRLERNDILYTGEEVTLQLMRLEKPPELIQYIKALREQLKETEAQLNQDEWERYIQLKKIIYKTKEEYLQREIDNIGMYISKDLGGLFHLEVKLKKAEKELEDGEAYCILETHEFGQAKTSTITLSKSKQSIIIIPQLLHREGVDFKPLIIVYNGWSKDPKIYAIRGYMSTNLIWIDGLLPRKQRAKLTRDLHTRLFRISMSRSFSNNYPSAWQH